MNIKITKSSYKTKENKRAIIYDCSAKNYRKKINTGVFVEDDQFENPEIPIQLYHSDGKFQSFRPPILGIFCDNSV